MTPITRHLQDILSELPFSQVEKNPLNWIFTESIKKLGPDFYRKVIPLHLVLSLEYSLLGQQLRAKFLSKQLVNQKEIEEQLITALMMAELLEHIYQYYLDVPREVVRLRQQQKLYRELLAEIIKPLSGDPKKLKINPSFSQDVRNTTVFLNLYRLLFIRSKRAFDVIATLGTVSESYRNFVKILDKYTDPILADLAWLFFIPRLSVNLFLLVKHTLPGPWMSKEEKSLGLSVRFNAQMQRRWFELGNDSVWMTAGLINRFVLTGALAPFAIYVSITCFAIDIILSVTRAYIELSRLYELQKQYKEMLKQTSNSTERKKIEAHLDTIKNQLDFEWLRLGSHMMTTTAIFLSMAVALPILAFNPFVIAIGAVCLVAVCFINFALFQIIDECRPKDALVIPQGGLPKLGFFAKKEQKDPIFLSEHDLVLEQLSSCSI
ncbi:hypothetical protein [Legionella cincinnatiensis]|uniref:Coiled-coil protein n=1 Tax=Legionella cincinnatiensis TaxID=28085 RepID=A0A378INV7_9GAMM|nr:hypothetical protein [Legionella cincinnatiensis]KTC93882.1 hypothetical protein Lcin_0112 [Legionella cincinnatiensis]STX36630.1 Uncharacterised protein [Legionella cincinnatiensis]